MGLLITLLIIALVVFVAFWIVNEIGLPHPINLIVKVIVGVIALIYLLNALGGVPGLH